jgi:hypothetical protein
MRYLVFERGANRAIDRPLYKVNARDRQSMLDDKTARVVDRRAIELLTERRRAPGEERHEYFNAALLANGYRWMVVQDGTGTSGLQMRM